MAPFRDTLVKELQFLYVRDLQTTEEFESHLGPGDLSAREVLRAHYCIAQHFLDEGEGIGGIGSKDAGLLLSALSRQHVRLGTVDKYPSVHDKAATLLFGLIMNHPFHDANKRTAYLSTVHYLYSQGYMIGVSEKALEDMTVLIAERALSKFRRFKELKKKVNDPEVLFLSHYLKQNTRKIDRRQYLVTYRELQKILSRYGVSMENPQSRTIDVVKDFEVVKRTGLFGRQTKTIERRRVCAFGFAGWTKTVGKGRLDHLRKQLELTPEFGIDSQAFFNEVDDMKLLLGMYENALVRLAYR